MTFFQKSHPSRTRTVESAHNNRIITSCSTTRRWNRRSKNCSGDDDDRDDKIKVIERRRYGGKKSWRYPGKNAPSPSASTMELLSDLCVYLMGEVQTFFLLLFFMWVERFVKDFYCVLCDFNLFIFFNYVKIRVLSIKWKCLKNLLVFKCLLIFIMIKNVNT